MSKDYYKVLGVEKTADGKEIKAAYRSLARQYHPDVNPGDAHAEENFKLVGEAYEVLSDAKRRAEYDEERKAPKPQAGAPRTGAGASAKSGATGGAGGNPFGGMGGGKDAFSSMMDDLLGTHGARRATPGGKAGPGAAGAARPGPTAATPSEQTIEVTLEEALHGATRPHRIDVDEACANCRGTGKSQSGRDGLNLGAMCQECRGTGWKTRHEEASVTVPAGIGDGAKLRLRGKGPFGRDGQRGDLLLTVRLKKHPLFERDGSNLTFDLPVPYTVAALGGDIPADVLGAKKTVSVPRGAQGGQKLRLAGQGLPGLRDRPAGDLFARLKVVIPKDLSSREETLLRELAQLRKDPVRA